MSTGRDRRAIAEGADPREVTAADYMTAAPAAVHLDADIHEVAATMFELECRHLPVLSEDDGQVIGHGVDPGPARHRDPPGR